MFVAMTFWMISGASASEYWGIGGKYRSIMTCEKRQIA